MTLPFWRGYQPGVMAPMAFHAEMPIGTRMEMLWNDGDGLRRVTDIDWAMWKAFNRFDDIVREGARKLAAIPAQMTLPAHG